jgi:hypothetical protein
VSIPELVGALEPAFFVDPEAAREALRRASHFNALHRETMLKALYRAGGEVSERQWRDVLGVLEVQRDLDVTYLKRWSVVLGVADLVGRALEESAAR